MGTSPLTKLSLVILLITLLHIVFFMTACSEKRQVPPSIKVYPVQTGKLKPKSMPSLHKVKDVADTASIQISLDTVSHDSLKNNLRESNRKLDYRYFRKSLNLHRKSFIANVGVKLRPQCGNGTPKNSEIAEA
jgi:hypothetical protein